MGRGKVRDMKPRRRCGWVTEDPLYIRYHDDEWPQ